MILNFHVNHADDDINRITNLVTSHMRTDNPIIDGVGLTGFNTNEIGETLAGC